MHDTLNNAIGEIGRLSRQLIDKQVEISNLTAENERLLAALEEICKVQNTYRSREQELAAMCLNQQSESNDA